MEIIYFKADAETSNALFEEWKLTQEPIKKLVGDILEEYGADSLYTNSEFLWGLAFKAPKPEEGKFKPEIKQRDGFRGEAQERDGQWYVIYRADKRRKQGKQFAKRQEAYNSLMKKNPCFSDFVVEKLGIQRMVVGEHAASRTGVALYYSVAGMAKGIVVVKVPVDQEHSAPKIPAGYTEIKKSEFVALTEE
jgi:hypothetical protein